MYGLCGFLRSTLVLKNPISSITYVWPSMTKLACPIRHCFTYKTAHLVLSTFGTKEACSCPIKHVINLYLVWVLQNQSLEVQTCHNRSKDGLWCLVFPGLCSIPCHTRDFACRRGSINTTENCYPLQKAVFNWGMINHFKKVTSAGQRIF